MTNPDRTSPSSGYRAYVLVILVLIYTSNFIDRMILAVLGQPIKVDLGLSDTQLGALSLAFAILYSVLGLPIAKVAERTKRVTVITAALSFWSLMTALCGLAGGYWQLMLARIGVGVGEAGCVPPSASLLSDYYPPERRATAAGLYSLGIPLGTILGVLIGGYVAQAHGWRAAFFVVGLPGLALALLFQLTVREPLRGAFDTKGDTDRPSIVQVARKLIGKPTFIHLALGCGITSFAGYGITTFAIPFLIRGFGLSVAGASVAFAVFGGLAAAVGVGMGGAGADWLGRKDKRLYVLAPAVGFIVAAPLYMAAFLQSTLPMLAAFIVLPAILQYIYLGPASAVCQNMVGPRERAVTSAILTLIINLIGLGLGPVFIGAASDFFAANAYAGAGAFLQACPGGVAPAGAGPATAAACADASFRGLQSALVASSAVYLWAAVHFILAARTIRKDLEV